MIITRQTIAKWKDWGKNDSQVLFMDLLKKKKKKVLFMENINNSIMEKTFIFLSFFSTSINNTWP